MEFIQYKCPVCKKQFENGDDIVVCPECGAPHHRECYEQNEKCFFEDKHSADFSFESYYTENNDETADFENICPTCRFNNPPGVMFCTRCGSPLHEQRDQSNPFVRGQQPDQNQNAQGYGNSQSNRQTPPFGFGAAGVPNFDPMAGLNNDEEITEGIKAGEMAKFIGKNTNYFLMVFDRIRKIGRSKFNFCAFLLSGIYFLYRKMYVFGIIFSLFLILTTVVSTYIRLTPEYNAAYQEVLNYVGNRASYGDPSAMLSIWNKMGLLYVPEIITWLRYAMMLFSGFLANRLYLNHASKSIKKIKSQNNEENIDEKLTAKGGVNLALALSFGIAVIVITMICEYIQLTSF